ncbi:hypothetical protein PCANC_26627 [Puccinia coronata f. sp. avenae]|uniref:MoaB/Mog domain-containing protein n=1 Tax=Puccinia coronata f. sp. avenae TaxID=200324 RepID=A0A2N5S248_9BASI|nr:hypothetical protein PCANC_26627 [Puccinia coronata f. sp. avenae]
MINLSRTIPNAQKPLCSTPRSFGTSTFGTIVLSLRSHHRPRDYPILGRSHGAWCSTLQGRSRGGSVLPRRMTTTSQEPLRFPVTPYPTEAELARREPVRTAGCVVIGDEILNGKTRDSNAHFLAQQAFRLGIRLATIVVVPDEENAIVQAVRTLCRPDSGVDIVITSGGSGPHMSTDGAIQRTEGGHGYGDRSAAGRAAPDGVIPTRSCTVLAVDPLLWVPVVALNHKVFILPGVPGLFQQLLQALLCHYIPLPPDSEKPHRLLLQTTLPESLIAPILSRLAEEFSTDNIKLGSYPNLVSGIVNVSLIGTHAERLDQAAARVQRELDALGGPNNNNTSCHAASGNNPNNRSSISKSLTQRLKQHIHAQS